jgi:dephospho-CoA kinase
MNRIAIIGKMGSGKTHLANILRDQYGYKILSFGNKIKEIAYDLFSMTDKDRLLIQTIADKMKEIDEYVWVNYIVKTIESQNQSQNEKIVIDDCRFVYEYEKLESLGFIFIYLEINTKNQIENLKQKYNDNYYSHINRMSHNSESYIEKIGYKENNIIIDSNNKNSIFEFLLTLKN